ncbi:MAG: autotransporter assembly complex protein TamA, partial [Stellaceae bacterium]
MRFAIALIALIFALAASAACADEPYGATITVSGGNADALKDALQNASQLVALQDRPPPSAAALRRRADDDLPRLNAALQALGYWQADVAYVIDTTKTPAEVRVSVTPGPLFHLRTVQFVLASGAPAPLMTRLGAGAVGLDLGGPALSAPVAAANNRIVARYAENGRPFAKVTDRRVVVDVATASMTVAYTIEPGATARFGATTVTGLKDVSRSYVTRRIAWQEGANYDQHLVDETTQALVKSGLFSGIAVSHAAAPAPDGAVAMSIALTEAPPHSVGIGAGYNTNIGLGANTFWEDRNLFGNAEDLRLSAGAAQRQVGLAATFRRPDLLVRKQDLLADAELLTQHTDAYNSRRARTYVGLEELMLPPYILGGGISLERAYIKDTSTQQNENYLLLGTPLYFRRDTTDDLLNPTVGTRLSLTTTPYLGLLGPPLEFVSTRIDGRYYHRLTASDAYVIALYGALGSIEGASLAGLPVDKRLYAGGAGSVRGYA